MTPKKIPFSYNINRMCAVDLISIIHIDDYDTRFIELHLTDEGEPLAVDGSTVTARFVTVREKYLLSDNVPCEADGNTITIPIDAAAVQSMSCDIKIEVNIVNGEKILTLPFPLLIRVRGSILQDAEITPESRGTIPELLEEVKAELERVEGYVDEERVEEIIDSKGYITAKDISGKEDKSNKVASVVLDADITTQDESNYVAVKVVKNLFRIVRNTLIPNAVSGKVDKANIPNNKLVAGDGDGGIKAAPYFVTDYSDDIDVAIPAGLPTCKAVHDSVDAAKGAAISEAAKYVTETVQTGSGISGELVSADGVGTLKRSGYAVSNSESSIQDVTTKEHTIPTARAVAKAIKAISQIRIVSGAVDANGHIEFTDSDGNTFTTTGESVIGADGASITNVEIRSGDLYITISDGSTAQLINVGRVRGENGVNGLNGAGYIAAEINSDGELVLTFQSAYAPGDSPYEKQVNLGRVVGATGDKGDKGDKGDTYTLTAADKTDIANIVLGELPTTEGVLYGNTSN